MWMWCCLAMLAAEPELVTWDVEGVARQGLVYWPAKPPAAEGAAVVLAFHGHGGTGRSLARNFPIHEHWPEAVVIYPQGLPTPGGLVDPEGKLPGWQRRPGQEQDRDVKLVDTILDWVAKQRAIDTQRVYATGHSNGGAMTYLLWAVRAERFAGFAPSSSPSLAISARMKPRPVLHLAGEHDRLVPLASQLRTMDAVRRINGCAAEGRPWGQNGTLYPSAQGASVVTVIHPGGHELPRDAAQLVVRFFREVAGGDRQASSPPAGQP
jgi:polyhydroxybutyrate depolymerase